MARTKRLTERDYYPYVERFLKRRFGCFVTGQDKGTKYGRVDVIGIRDLGGAVSDSVEIIAVEVKAGTQPFNTATGQAYGYSVYADRCYLADCRTGANPFSLEEIDIASKLGVGLLAIRTAGGISEIMASPQHIPLAHMRASIIEKLGYSQCTVCGSVFKRGDNQNFEKYVKRSVQKAFAQEQGFVYWLHDIDKRKRQGMKYVYERRYICADCIWNLYEEVLQKE